MSDQGISSSVAVNDRYEEDYRISLLAKDQYMREIRWNGSLSDEERQKLLDRIARARREPGNAWCARLAKDARDGLIVDLQPLALHVAKRYIRMYPALEVLDLVQEANMSLLRMFERCAIPNVKALQTLAFYYMRGRMLNIEDDQSEGVHLPWRIQRDVKSFCRLRSRLRDVYGCEPSYKELARELGVSVSRVCELVDYDRMQSFLSLQSLVSDDFSEDKYCFVDVFGSGFSETVQRNEEWCHLVRSAIEGLSPLQRNVVSLCCSLDDQTTVRDRQDVAAMLGISVHSVSNTYFKARKRLRAVLAPVIGIDQESVA